MPSNPISNLPTGFEPLNSGSSASTPPSSSNYVQPSQELNTSLPPGFVPVGSDSSSNYVQPKQGSNASLPPGFIPVDGGVSSSTNEPDEDGKIPADEGTFQKIWRVANTPLTESVLGWNDHREGAGGFERGAEKLLGGLSSPVSLILTAATLPFGGEGGLIESAGSNVLKDALVTGGADSAAAAEEVGKFGQATKAALKAIQSDTPVDQAVEATGMNYNRYLAMDTMLKDASLDHSDLVGGNTLERGTSSVFRKLGVTPVQAQKVAKGLETALNAGFTVQQGYQAMHTLPKVMDLWKEGDYDDANEALVEGLASAGFAAVGAKYSLAKAGELMPSLNEVNKLRPTEQARQVQKMYADRAGEIKSAEQDSVRTEAELNEEFGKPTYYGNLLTAGVKSLFNTLTESKESVAARDDLKRLTYVALDTGLDDTELARQKANAIYDALDMPEKKVAFNPETAVRQQTSFNPDASSSEQGPLYTKTDLPPAALSGVHPSLPDDLSELVQKASSYPQKVKDQMLQFADAYSRLATGLTSEQTDLVNKLRDINDDNWTKASSAGIINSYVDNYVQRIIGPKAEQGAGTLLNEVRSGRFDLKADQALHRTYGSAFEALMRGHTVEVTDPVQLAGYGIQQLRTIAANQNFLDGLRANGVVGSDGRPVTILRGSGAAMGQRNGGEPALLIKPNQVRNLEISENSINNMQQSGMLDRHLASGDIVDITPRVNPDNIDNWINRRQQEVNDAGNRNPALYDQPAARNAIGQTHEFVTSYANKIAETVQSVMDGFTPASALDEIKAPQWLKDVAAKERVPASDRSRVEEYIDRHNNHAQGLTVGGVSDLRNGDISRLLEQSKGSTSQLSPELQSFWDKQGYVDNKGEWVGADEKINSRHVAQIRDAATDTNYPQLKGQLNTLKAVKSGALGREALAPINDAEPKTYVWHPQDYVTPSKRLTGVKWVAKTDDGTGVFVDGDVAFHPEFAPYLKNALGLSESELRKNEGIGQYTSPLLKAGKTAKSLLLSFSPFHMMQEGLRGIMLGVNPLKVHPVDSFSLDTISRLGAELENARNAIKDDPSNVELQTNAANIERNLQNSQKLRRVAAKGGTFNFDRAALADHSEGLSAHNEQLSKIPVLGKALDWYQDFLFNRYMPSLKADAAVRMYDKYAGAHPEWQPDAVAKATAEHVNNAFGGQDWKAMGRAAATQDWFSLFALAPDWLESEMRFAASTLRGGLGDKNFSRQQVLLMSAGLWGVARALNLLNTGDMHLEAPFGVATKDKDGREVVYSVRTMPTDILHMASDPEGFLKGRMSPIIRTASEAVSGYDSFGRKLAPGDLWVDIARNMAPIPFQAAGEAINGQTPAVGNAGQFAKAGGLTAQVYHTEAQKTALELASQRNESGPLDEQKMGRQQALSRFEDEVRSGRMSLSNLEDAKDFGDLKPDEFKDIRKNIKLTAGMDPETARMVSRVSRLDMPGALQVWDAATPRERAALSRTMIAKKQRYVSKAEKDMTPQERLADPTFRRIRSMWSDTGVGAPNPAPTPQVAPQAAPPISMLTPDGHIWEVPPDKVQEALSRGAKVA